MNIQGGGSINIAGSVNVTEEDTKNLSESIKKLSGAAEQISKMAELTEATQKYLEQLAGISQSMERFNEVTSSLTNVSDERELARLHAADGDPEPQHLRIERGL